MEQDQVEQRLKLENQHMAGANWFFWIAGLSLINSVLSVSGTEWAFIVGLGITQFIDAVFVAVAESAGDGVKLVALFLDVVAAAVFVLFGVLSRQRHLWAFVTGMVLYSLDGLLFLLVQDWLSIGFHAFALLGIYGGLRASRALREQGQPGVVVPA